MASGEFFLSNFGKAFSTGGISNTLMIILGWVGGAVVFITLLIFAFRFSKNKKSYNIPVTIWIARSDNKVVDEIVARGGYFKTKPVGGITTFRVKRKGVPIAEIPPPDSKFLVGLSRHLYLIQKGMDDFEPVLPESFLEVVTEKGEKLNVVELKCINQDATAWKFDNENSAKQRFTLFGFWEKYKDFIQMSIFVFIVFLAIYITWIGLKDVAVALGEVANTLKGGGAISIS